MGKMILRRTTEIRTLVLVFTLVLCVGTLQSQALTLQQPIAAPNVPTLSTFKINGDAATTPTQSVILNNQALVLTGSGPVTHYRASERADFVGAVWNTYSTAPAFTLSAGVGVKTVFFQVKNVTGPSNILSDTITYQIPPPQVTSFRINAGATTTATQSVTLDNVVTAAPTAYRVSESPTAISTVPWVSTYSASMPFTLSAAEGAKTLYYQVKNANGESNVMSANITYQKRQLYTIKAWDFHTAAKPYGFNYYAHPKSIGATCSDVAQGNQYGYIQGVLGFYVGGVIGSRCDFSLFEGQALQNGFVFKTYKVYSNLVKPASTAEMNLLTSPTPGSTSVNFTFHGWSNAGAWAEFSLDTITLEGPAGMDWKKALMP